MDACNGSWWGVTVFILKWDEIGNKPGRKCWFDSNSQLARFQCNAVINVGSNPTASANIIYASYSSVKDRICLQINLKILIEHGCKTNQTDWSISKYSKLDY